MLSVNPQTIARLIALSRAFHAKEEVVIHQEPNSPSDDWALQALASHEEDEFYGEFVSIVDDLEPDQQQEVVALLWLGRGDGTAEEWDDLLQQAAEQWNPRTADYLLAHPLLSEHLREGLDLLGYEEE